MADGDRIPLWSAQRTVDGKLSFLYEEGKNYLKRLTRR